MASEVTTTYDEVPYDSQPVARTHPSHLGAIARLFGMDPKPAQRAQVLELGCASGHNLFGLAAAYPQSSFVGIDLSRVQIEQGKALLAQANLPNVRLEQMSILDVGQEFGTFDYIICHGIFSWVPEPVRRKILEICRSNLSPQGVAYISYNTYPGWRVRETIRQMMLYHAERHERPSDKCRAARAILTLVASATESLKTYGDLFRAELEQVRRMPDWYLFHDFLSEVNQPFYFSEFMQLADAAGLQYLCDSEVPKLLPQEFRPEAQRRIARLSSDRIRTEQYVDFLRNRMFRRTLLVHREVALPSQLGSGALEGLFMSGSLRALGTTPNGEVAFCSRGGGRIVVRDPLTARTLELLAARWPTGYQGRELLEVAAGTLGSDAVVDGAARQVTLSTLLRAYLAGLVELSLDPSPTAFAIGTTPRSTELARYLAANGKAVINLLNEPVELTPLERQLIALLDGTRSVSELLQLLQHSDASLAPSESIAFRSELDLTRQLERLAEHALLMA
ncbi:MAG: class I SAM-dependent methyltransferase [Bdellovibrionales bacterium]|nr:class I SAM-dependent methyltransferase [Bdellovibrionales bacterium]